MAKQKGTTVITNEVRLSYVSLVKPKESDNGGKPKYSVCAMIPKKDKETVNAIVAAYTQAYNEAITKNWGGKKAVKKAPLRDGDEEKPDNAEFKGMYFFNASSVRKPQVVDKATGQLAEEDEIYSGMWGKLSLNLYGYDTQGSKGVAFAINGVLKTKDDENLSGGSNAFADFADDLEDAGILGLDGEDDGMPY